ncbi:MarR family transcriptional regulator [uncultured Tateyamaria sp.]|uniref:MarR family winged helix-turn-helix transcriptional regulator n=1 Tax=uncultured Tateyamaria sp. TaxID=455651 RepID=UPI00262A6FC4|nr:MarR family transcriptional regulator [uncultured Tateyamaria sp.]
MTRKEPNLHFLLHSAALVEDVVRHELRPLGVGHSQARVLDALDRMGPSSQIELADECNITAASMSTMTMRLLASGFIVRRQDPNEKRSNILRLSKTGASLLSDVRAIWHKVDRIIEGVIGADKAATIFKTAEELRDALGGRTAGERRAKRDGLDTDVSVENTHAPT